MKNDKNEVAQAIAKEISKYSANSQADNGTFHNTLGLTKRESEARKMAGWFLKNVEKMENDGDPDNDFNQLQNQLIDLAIEITGK
jgi:hypothetical protein